ncbi:MAG: DEAD/DEAH box helicase, partial [Rhizobiaceae bacterium]
MELELGDKLETVFVLLPIPAERPYSYGVPQGMALAPGDYVQVPLGPRKVAAVVWDAPINEKPIDPKKLRLIVKKFDCPPLPSEMRKFIDWVADYTVSPAGMVLKSVLRAPGALDPEPMLDGLRFKGEVPARLSKARGQVIDLLLEQEGMAWTRSGLAQAAGVSTSVVGGMEKLELFEAVKIPQPPVVAEPIGDHAMKPLRGEQIEAAAQLVAAAEADKYSCCLLDGITGSGKTEVYFEAVAKALEQGKQVLILLPEIALTATFLERFEERFGAPPAQWHSGLSPKKRERIWRQVANGQVRVVAGARSALFLPFKELGLTVVDEEHDGAYKQEDRVFYSARDMAVVRASIGKFPCILASATPSIESRVNAEAGRYTHVKMLKRHGDAVLPTLST